MYENSIKQAYEDMNAVLDVFLEYLESTVEQTKEINNSGEESEETAPNVCPK